MPCRQPVQPGRIAVEPNNFVLAAGCSTVSCVPPVPLWSARDSVCMDQLGTLVNSVWNIQNPALDFPVKTVKSMFYFMSVHSKVILDQAFSQSYETKTFSQSY